MADGIRRGRRRFSRLLGSLNVRKEVKQSFTEKEKQKYLVNHVKCILLHFRQTNELKTAYRPMCPCHVTLTSRSREKECKLKVKKVQALFALSKIVFILQKKLCQWGHISSANDFFTCQNFFNCHHSSRQLFRSCS